MRPGLLISALLVVAGCRVDVKTTEVKDGVLQVADAQSLTAFEQIAGCDTLVEVPRVEKGLGGEAAVLSLQRHGTFVFASIITPFINAQGKEQPQHLQHTPVSQVAQPGDAVCKAAGERRFTVEHSDSLYEFVALPVTP